MKKKNNEFVLSLIFFVTSFFIGWYLLNSILFGILYGVSVYGMVVKVFQLKKKDDIKYKNIENAYQFVNMMNVQMIATTNLYESYKTIENYLSVDFSNILIEDFKEQLNDIASNYDLNSFKIYIKTLCMYDNDGGAYLEMEKIPSSLCQKCKINYFKMKAKKRSKLLDITTLYALWILILMFLKSALLDYYDLMMSDMSYQLIMFAILIVGSVSYCASFCQFYKNKIKGL